jgi:hypothetical protein
VEAGWARQLSKVTDVWTVIRLELAGGNPSVAKDILNDCTYTEVAEAWQINRRSTLGVGYRIKTKGR